MSRLTLLALLIAPLACAQQQPPTGKGGAQGEAKRVRVTAEGFNRDDALKQALRKALERGAGTQIAGFSRVENFALIRDTIYSRASGIVSEYRILEEREGAGGTVIMTIAALVRPDAVARAWGELQNVLDQVGRPRIMVWVDERIDGRLQPESIVAARIEQMFVKAGFDLVERKAVEEIRRREAADARDRNDAARLARLAKDAGAHILVRGAANADRAGLENLYGVPAAFYNCDVQAKIYYTDTGRLLASESLPVTRAGVRSRREFSPQAARAALVQATFPAADAPVHRDALATRLFEAVMEQWSIQISAGGDVELEITGLDFKGFVKIRKALAELERVQSVDGDYSDGAARFRIKARISAQNLAERLTQAPFGAWLEVTDLKPNRIRAKNLRP